MASANKHWITAALLLLGASIGVAQDSDPLMDLLIRKGVLSADEVGQLKAEVARADAKNFVSTTRGKMLARTTISGRFQIQYAGLGTDIDGTSADPASTSHFFMRRMYLGARADLADGWSGNLNYDFAGSTFDAAFVEWKRSDAMVLDVGFRKVPFGLEEWYTSSGNLRAIERSPATRFFVESNNGRRLGAGSYRTGIYLGGRNGAGLFYNVAVTNPERDESAAGVIGAGSAATNSPAYWANVGWAGSVGEGKLVLSSSVGLLPDQGGRVLGAGDDLTVYNLFAEYSGGPFDLQLEYFTSQNEHGVSATQDSSASAWSIQPAYKVGKLEYVVRYTLVDSDGRGLTLSDLVRSAPSGGTMDKLTELFAGFNYYILGNDMKWQLGYVAGQSKDTITGGSAKAKTQGVRSQVQLNF